MTYLDSSVHRLYKKTVQIKLEREAIEQELQVADANQQRADLAGAWEGSTENTCMTKGAWGGEHSKQRGPCVVEAEIRVRLVYSVFWRPLCVIEGVSPCIT